MANTNHNFAVMRRLRSCVLSAFLFVLCALVIFQGTGLALSVPEHPAGRVTDMAGLLTPNQVADLNRLLADFESKTSTQIAVLIIKSLEGENIEDYSIRVAEKWKLGQAKKDNGVLLLIAVKDRKIRIEVGYGLEGALPDGLAGSIIRNEIAPWFKKGKYYEGIKAGLLAIMKATGGEYRAATAGRKRRRSSSPLTSLVVFFIALMVIGNLFRRRRRRGSFPIIFWGGFGGGGFGGGFGGGGFSGGGGSFGGGGASGGW